MKVVTILLLASLSYSSFADERMPEGVVYFEDKVSAANLDAGTPLTEEVKNHFKKLSAPGDVVAAILDEKIGGNGSNIYNAVPMNPSARDIWKTKVIDVTYNYLKEHNTNKVMFLIIPFYENVDATRPYGFAVSVNKLDKNYVHIVKGYIPNPVSGTVSPYLYSTGNVSIVRRKNETIVLVGVGFDNSPLLRVEMATKTVRLSDLTTGTDLDEITKKHTKSLARGEPYVPGLLISQKLGGKGDDPYNVVPMDPKALEAFKTLVDVPTLQFFKDPANKDKTSVITVSVLYADIDSTRPVGFFVLREHPPTYTHMYNTYVPNK